jgi:hypothetical protein
MESFEILQRYQHLPDFRLAINHLARQLLQEEVIRNNAEYREIAESILAATEVQ